MKRMYSLLRFSGRCILVFCIFIFSYLGAAHLVSRFEINSTESKLPKTEHVYILSNGVHTDLVLPIRSKAGNWADLIPFDNTKSKDSNHRYIAFGWGDKGFYLNTPTWSQLKTSTAFNAAFGLSTTAIHTTYYYELKESSTCKKIALTEEQLSTLYQFVKHSFQLKKGKPIYIQTDAVYGVNDTFYEANGTYSLFHTCNSWANAGLQNAGLKCAPWTAFQGGIFCHYAK